MVQDDDHRLEHGGGGRRVDCAAGQPNNAARTSFSTPAAADLTTYVGGAPSTQNFAPATPLQVTYDLRTSAMYGSTPADVLSLNHARLVYTSASEPASIVLLVSGIGGIAAARRRSTRAAPYLACSVARQPGAHIAAHRGLAGFNRYTLPGVR